MLYRDMCGNVEGRIIENIYLSTSVMRSLLVCHRKSLEKQPFSHIS